jgi:hypothetical protein
MYRLGYLAQARDQPCVVDCQNYWIMNNFVVFVPIIMANNFVK